MKWCHVCNLPVSAYVDGIVERKCCFFCKSVLKERPAWECQSCGWSQATIVDKEYKCLKCYHTWKI